MKYQEAKEIFSRARNKEIGARLDGRSTRLVATAKGFGIQYHNTVVVEILPKDKYVLNTGGFRTRTTKERINEYSPINVYSHKRVWRVSRGGWGGESSPAFTDGMVVDGNGKILKAPGAAKAVKREARMLKAIEEYACGFRKALEEKRVEPPSGGDCWGCLMRGQNGEEPFGHSHLEEHIKEKYYVPSLLIRALEAKGFNPAYVNPWNGLRADDLTLFKRALKDYLIKRLCK